MMNLGCENAREVKQSPLSGTKHHLLIFQGVIGIHRFYLGYIITGILQPKNGSYDKTL
jgi:TM2 domain-containing membrane protein YozV